MYKPEKPQVRVFFALISPIYFSLFTVLANCRGEECGPEELVRCSRPLEKFSYNNNLGLGTLTATKEELEQICP